jgi:hypothetical protein
MSLLTLFAQSSLDYGDPYYLNSYTAAKDYDLSGAFLIGFLVGIVFYIIGALLLGNIFKKAGAPAWKAWVPVYNSWTVLKLGGQNGFWAILALIPVINIISAIFMIIAMYHIGRGFGKGDAFVLLAIFLPLVWLIWLAADGSTWKGAALRGAQSSKH